MRPVHASAITANRVPLVERVMLFRPLTGELLHPEVWATSGSDTRALSQPGDITFTVPAWWHAATDINGDRLFGKRQTLVVVERANRTIRNVGLVDDLTLTETGLDVSCGGFSMIAGQSGPWEGRQGWFMETDPIELFRMIVDQVQSYADADLGIRVTGDTRSGSTVGYPGSRRWQQAKQALDAARPNFDLWTDRQRKRERAEQRLYEAVFKAVGLKRIGTIAVADSEPDNPGWEHDSTIWVHESQQRAYRWRDGRWVSQSQADRAVKEWQDMKRLAEYAKHEVDRYQYQIEPLEDRMEALDAEKREPYTLYFWQNHDMNTVIQDMTELGPFEYREQAQWVNEQLDLQLEVGSPRVGVRRDELHLELGVNVQEQPAIEHGDVYTGVALFGAGTGSAVLSEQRDLNVKHAVRNVLVETDNDAHTRALTRSAANTLMDDLRKNMGFGFTDVTIYHTEAVPEGSFDVGDQLPITGQLSDGTVHTQWVRVREATHEWGSNKTSVEVEAV